MDAMSARPRRWNHNLQYHPVILGAVPAGCRRALAVGCGEGMLARELRQVVPDVTGIDRDAASIDRARPHDAGAGMRALLAPGGVLAIVGLARNRYPADLPFVLAGAVGHRVHTLSKPCWRYSLVWIKPA
jgi:SAM-dependent methyltransferase